MYRTTLFLCLTVFLCGCSDEKVQTYQVPKESVATAAPAPAMTHNHQAPAPEKKYEATLPEGWKENPGSGMRMVSYTIADSSVDFYLTSLSMGDLASNVNRWRGQVGLEAASAEEIDAAAETIEVDGYTARYIEVYNEEGGKGIIAAIIDLTPQYWYFTAKGPVDELQEHAADIKSFLEGVDIL